jgi:glycosyltransferase involved in cell wall biosynthesis
LKIKVLWISLRIFSDDIENKTAVWLKSLAIKLAQIEDVEVSNISIDPSLKEISRVDYLNIKQWALPSFNKNKKGYPPNRIAEDFRQILFEVKPEIIQIWGSENPLGLLPITINYPAIKLFTMQGVLASIEPNSLLGLSFREKISTIGIRELLTRRNIFTIAKSFRLDGIIENQMIEKSRFIVIQSDWTEFQIKHINPEAKLFRVNRELRPEFLCVNQKWSDFSHESPIIYSAAVGYTLKGLHVLLRALIIIKQFFPNVELRLAGKIGRVDFLGDGYLRLLNNLIIKNNLSNNVKWLGPLNSNEIINNLQNASVFVNPSFVESYSMVVAEAMSIGTPCVLSFAGAMPELAENGKEALFFTPGDYKQLAHLIIKFLNNKSYAHEVSLASQKRSFKRLSSSSNALEQYEIYKEIIRYINK